MPFLMGYCVAIIASQFQTALLSPWYCAILALLAAFLWVLHNHCKNDTIAHLALVGLLIGVCYSNLYASHVLRQQLPKHLEQQEITLTVKIASTPSLRQYYWRTISEVVESPESLLKKIRLDWYGDQQPKACQVWRVLVRLKQPHGLRNPGTWNARLAMLEKGIQATGYIRQATLLDEGGYCVHRLREQWHGYVLSQLPAERAAWIIALSTGDKSFLSRQQYRLLQVSGINHLFVISGLHIGLAASLVYGVVLFFRRLGLGLLFTADWRPTAALLALLAALLYAALADFVIPTQRALVMIIVFFAAQVAGIRLAIWLRFWLAMAVVLSLNPLSATNVGFALSFTAVALLIVCAQHIQRQQQPLNKWRLAIASQLYIAVGLSPLLLGFFHHLSLSGPWINVFAIPIVSLIVLPMVLFALLSWLVFTRDFSLLASADKVLQYLFAAIRWCNERFLVVMDYLPAMQPSSVTIALLVIVCLLLALPRYLPARFTIACLLVLTMMIADKPYQVELGALRVQVLDVGQGLSVLVRTAQHQLLYDTGAAWSQGSMAQQVVQPVLNYYALGSLDKVIISHFDNDHAGGWRYLHDNMPVQQWLGNSTELAFDACYAGMSWHWDGVDFQIVSPNFGEQNSGNDGSCALLIKTAQRSVLLPGDIGKAAEVALLRENPALNTIDVLIAPHHGSNSSSSYPLVEKAQQAIVVFATGYLNRYQHPHEAIVKRYQSVQATLFNTASDGMVSIDIDQQGNVKASRFRQQALRYWDAVPANHLEY